MHSENCRRHLWVLVIFGARIAPVCPSVGFPRFLFVLCFLSFLGLRLPSHAPTCVALGEVDQSFDDIMCHSSHSAISDFVAPTRSVFPPARPLEVDQNLSPKSWTYDNIHVPEGMRIAAPPNRAMHDSHMRKLNAFLKAVHNKPESLHVAVGVKREVEDILTCIADGQWSRHGDAFADQIVTSGTSRSSGYLTEPWLSRL